MTNLPADPPRGLGWLNSPWTRLAAFLLVLVSIGLTLYVGYRYVALADCLRTNDDADSKRTSVIATATDAERKAQRVLIAARTPTEAAAARSDALAAYDATDRARAANPPNTRRCR